MEPTVVVGAVIALAAVYGLVRNEWVHSYQMRQINKAYQANLTGIRQGEDDKKLQQRWEWFESVSYQRMFFQFWRRLDSFYGPMP